MNRLLLLLCFLLSMSATVLTQSTTGTEFWLGYMENLNLAFNDAPAFSIVINSDVATNGVIELPATGLSIPFNAGIGITEVFLPDGVYYSEDSEVINNNGIRVTTQDPVRIQAIHYRLYFAESTNLLPTNELGSSYLVTTMLDDGEFHPSSLVIVATADESEIQITPSVVTLGLRPAGVPFTITLSAGQIYQIQSLEELTGTEVQSLSGHPIAVFGGAQQANINDGFCPGGADSHVWDQTLPLEDWRNLYYFVPFSGQGGDRVRILAATDNTRVFFDCEEVATLDEGAFFDGFLTEATVISSTNAISLTQYTNGYSCEPSQIGDPNGLSYLPADFRGTNYRWLASGRLNPTAQSGRHFDRHYITVLGPEEAMANVLLDGDPITGISSFSANPEWEYSRMEVSPGAHTLTAQQEVQVYSYGFGFADSYTNHLGYTEITPETFACLEIEREGALCADSIQQFTYESNLNLVDFNWAFGNGDFSTEEEPIYVYTTPGTYEVTLTATDVNGLEVNTTIMFTVLDCDDDPCADLAPINIQGFGQACVDSVLLFNVVSDANLVDFSWTGGGQTGMAGTFFVTFDTPGPQTISLSALDENDCAYTTQLELLVIDCPEDCANLTLEGFSYEGVFCVDSSFSITGTYTSAIDAIELWTVFDPSQFIKAPIITQDAFPGAGSYQVNFLVEQVETTGCFIDTTITVVVEDCLPDCSGFELVDFASPETSCVDSLLVLTADFMPQPDSISWVSPGLTSLSGEEVEFRVSQPGLLSVNLRAFWPNGCAVDTTITLDVQACASQPACKLMLPNVFSPNNDGVNDRFKSYFQDACTPLDFTLEIFNRWGSLVFQTNDPFAGWDGQYLGKPHSQGVLIYRCRAIFPDGTVLELKGDVTLIR